MGPQSNGLGDAVAYIFSKKFFAIIYYEQTNKRSFSKTM